MVVVDNGCCWKEKWFWGFWAKLCIPHLIFVGASTFSLAPSPQIHLKSKLPFTLNLKLSPCCTISQFQVPEQVRSQSQNCESIYWLLTKLSERINLKPACRKLSPAVFQSLSSSSKNLTLTSSPIVRPIRVSSPVKYSYFDQHRRSIFLA